MPTYQNKPETLFSQGELYLRSDVTARKYHYRVNSISKVVRDQRVKTKKVGGVLYVSDRQFGQAVERLRAPTQTQALLAWWKTVPLAQRKKLRKMDDVRREVKRAGIKVSRNILQQTLAKLGWRMKYDYRDALDLFMEDERWYASSESAVRAEIYRRHGYTLGQTPLHKARRMYESLVVVNAPDPALWMTTREAAEARGVIIGTINRWARDGRIRTVYYHGGGYHWREDVMAVRIKGKRHGNWWYQARRDGSLAAMAGEPGSQTGD